MTNEEVIKRLTDILDEVTEDKNAICYVTNYDEEPLKMAIKALQEVDFLTFLMNNINKNELEKYFSMYNAQNEMESEEEE